MPAGRIERVAEEAGRVAEEATRLLTALALQGPRLTGSPAAQASVTWAMGQMRLAGLSGVHAEDWELPRGWTRGRAEARLLGPAPRALTLCAYGWTGSTRGRVQGDVLSVGATAVPRAGHWRGRVLLLEPGHGPGASNDDFFALSALARRAESGGAIALLVPDTRPGSMHTSPLSFPGESSLLPVAAITQEDALALRRHFSSGPRIELEITNRFTAGPVVSSNAVGEIAGTDGTGEVVLLGAHLDSWDLGPGATDDAYGVAAVLAAARAIAASGERPRRTIRVVLFNGEEQGLLGSRAYVRAHAAEMDEIVCALVMDWGSGPISKVPLAGHDELRDPLRDLLQQSGATRVGVVKGYLTYTDAFAFSATGVAGLALFQDSPNYVRDGHSAEDTLANTDMASLTGNVRLLATLAFGLADLATRPSVGWDAARIREEMKAVGAPAGLSY